jgi:hypothetical protein
VCAISLLLFLFVSNGDVEGGVSALLHLLLSLLLLLLCVDSHHPQNGLSTRAEFFFFVRREQRGFTLSFLVDVSCLVFCRSFLFPFLAEVRLWQSVWNGVVPVQ